MKIPPALKAKALLIRAWKAGVASVHGERVTRAAMAGDNLTGVTHLLAVGKAAASMCAGALEYAAADRKVLVVTKHACPDDAIAAHAGVVVVEAGHPLPDENSLRAGRAVEKFVGMVARRGRLVMLVSGGASALAEALPDGVGLERLRGLTTQLLAGGYPIGQINALRARLSRIKGGKLLRRFGGESVRVYAISDVPGDAIELIGGGIGAIHPPAWQPDSLPREMADWVAGLDDAPAGDAPAPFAYHAKIIGSNRIARRTAAQFLTDEGLPVVANEESLNRDVHAAAQQIAAELLRGPAGAYIWGGEPTVVLPPRPGVGGRNQTLALALAGEIRGRRDISALAAGTDGVDGPTTAAGALVDGDTFSAASGANNALLKADAGSYLARIAALFKPGPTGTNVMDLVIAIKQGARR